MPFDDEDDERDEEAELDIDDIEEMAEDEDGIDLFGDNFDRDYRGGNDERYRGRYIDDDEDHEELDIGARRELDARLDRRDHELARRRRMPAAFLQDDEDGDIDLTAQPRRRRHAYDEDRDDVEMVDDGLEELSLEELVDIKSSNITDWVTQPQVLRSIYREFKAFLTEFTDPTGSSVYGNKIKTL